MTDSPPDDSVGGPADFAQKYPTLADIIAYAEQQKAHALEREVLWTQRDLIERMRTTMREAIAAGLGYSQFIIGLGYAAFLSLWTALSDKLSRDVIVMSGGFLILSLVVFIGYIVANTAVLSIGGMDLGASSKSFRGMSPEQQAAALVAVGERHEARQAPLLMAWPFLFGLQAISGLAGAWLLGADAMGYVLGKLH